MMREINPNDFRLVKVVISTVITLIFVTLFTGVFNSTSENNQLDLTKIDTDKTSLEERITYYDKIDKKVEKMTEENQSKYFVTIELNFENFETTETIVFTRNDERKVYSTTTNEKEIKLPPGIYKVSNSNTTNVYKEMQLINPGYTYPLDLNYNDL